MAREEDAGREKFIDAPRTHVPTRSTREDVVKEARSWITTPYHLAANVKGAGVDCAMLILEIYSRVGLVEHFDPRPYSSDWMCHRSDEVFLGLVFARSHEITQGQAQPGDIVLFKVGRCYSHGGIITKSDPLTFVHAYKNAGMVIEDVIRQNAEIAAKLPTARFASYWPAEG